MLCACGHRAGPRPAAAAAGAGGAPLPAAARRSAALADRGRRGPAPTCRASGDAQEASCSSSGAGAAGRDGASGSGVAGRVGASGGRRLIVGAAAAAAARILAGGGRAALAASDSALSDDFGGGAGAPGGRLPREPLPRVPSAALARGLNVSRVIKGCWQLDGRHRGDPATDRTTAPDALRDFERFVRVGVTTFDAADVYGASCVVFGGPGGRAWMSLHVAGG